MLCSKHFLHPRCLVVESTTSGIIRSRMRAAIQASLTGVDQYIIAGRP